MGRFKRPIRRLKNGLYAFEIDDDLKRFIADLASQLHGVLGDDAPMLRRLFPTAYPDDPERDAGYQVLARGELIDQRHASINEVLATADQKSLSHDQLLAWMRTVNDLRLVLGTQLDVSEDDDGPDEGDPTFDSHHVYRVLGMVLEEIVNALT